MTVVKMKYSPFLTGEGGLRLTLPLLYKRRYEYSKAVSYASD
jgi:hypothetical protein